MVGEMWYKSRKTHTMSLALFPTHQNDHVFILIRSLWKSDEKHQEVPNNFNEDIIATKRETLRSDENDGLLSEGMRQAC